MGEHPHGGEQFLEGKYQLSSSKETETAVVRQEHSTGKEVEKHPDARIRAYLDRLIAILEPAEREGGRIDRMERNLNIIKRFLHEDLLVEPEPAVDSFLVHQRKTARNLGHGNVPEIPADMRDRIIEAVDDVAWGDDDVREATEGMEAAERQVVEEVVAKREAQRTSLDAWVNYLTSEDANDYPDWFKYWAFRSVMGLSEYDKESKDFPRRNETTVNPFPTLDRQALGKVLDAVAHHEKYRAEVSRVKAEIATAKRAQLSRSQEKQINRRIGELRRENPGVEIDRAAIMKELGINLPVEADLPELPDAPPGLTQEELQAFDSRDFAILYAREFSRLESVGDRLLRNTNGEWRTYPQGSDAKPLVDSIDRFKTGWCTAGIDVASSQLSRGDFSVYYSEDEDGAFAVPRVAIRMEDDKIAEVRGIAPNQNLDPYIADVVSEKMQAYPDGAAYEKKAADMARLTNLEGKKASGGVFNHDDLCFLYETDGKIEGFGYNRDPRIDEILAGRDVRTDLSSVFSCAPEAISLTNKEALSGGILFHYGNLDLYSLTSAEGLTLPQSVSGNLDLYSLTSAEGLTLPQSVSGNLDLHSLTSAEGLTLPQSVSGNLDLYRLTSAEGLTLPQSVSGDLDLGSLTSAEGLTLPQSVSGNLDLRSLTSAEGLTFPQSVSGSINLDRLRSAEGLTLPQSVSGYLNLHSLTSAEGLTLPQSVSGNLELRSLTSAEGLTLPQSVSGNLYLYSLTSAEKNGLRLRYPQLRIN